MTYQEYRDARQKAFNELPIFYAFGDDQFREQMEKRGLTENDTDKIYRLGGTGGFYLREDADVIRAFFNSKDTLHELMMDGKFAEDAFLREMFNFEYEYNGQGDFDVCSCFGDCDYAVEKSWIDYLKEMGYGDDTIHAYSRAKSRYYNSTWGECRW